MNPAQRGKAAAHQDPLSAHHRYRCGRRGCKRHRCPLRRSGGRAAAGSAAAFAAASAGDGNAMGAIAEVELRIERQCAGRFRGTATESVSAVR